MAGVAEHSREGWLLRSVDRKIPAELLSDPGATLRARVLVGSCLGLAALGLVTLVVRVATVPFDGTPVVISCVLALMLALPWLQRRTRSHRLPGVVLTGAMLVTIPLVHGLHGSFPEPSLLIAPLVPLLAVFLVDLRFGVLTAAALGVVPVALRLWLPPSDSAEMLVQSWTFAVVASVAPWMCVLVASAYERSSMRAQNQLRRAQKRSEEAFARAEAANRSKTEFLRHVSHELRTPLNAIMGFGELVREQAAAGGHTEIAGDVAQICHASDQLLALINDLLDVSRIEADAVDLDIREVDLGRLLMEVRANARPLIAANGNTLEISSEPDLPGIITDERRLRQIMLNLVSNSCKFTENGQIFLTATATDTGVALSVRDTGIGMSPAERAKIFEPFVQVHPSARRRQQGTGLGLSLSRRLVEALGGQIEVTSEPGRGTEFVVRLPRSR